MVSEKNHAGSNPSPVVSVQNLTAQYGSDRVLEDVNFEIHKGEVFVILGGSGCGKSTLLKHMIGLVRPHSGKIFIDGHEIGSSDVDVYRKILKKIGVLFQGSALIGSMSIAENIALPIEEYSPRLSRSAVYDLVRMKLSMVGLEEYGQHLPAELSGGMKKRAGLARALALNPKILFLDEPSSGLDPILSSEIDDLILRINRVSGATVVIVTHELASIFKIAGRIIMLEKSKKGIIAEGDPNYLKDHSENRFVRQFFNRNPDL